MNLFQEGKLKLKAKLPFSVVYHDPCYLGRYNEEYEAPRQVLKRSINFPLIEMERVKEKSFCCGGGGGHAWMELNIGKRMSHERLEEALRTKANVIGTACPFCAFMLDDAIKVKDVENKLQVKDLAEILAECV